MRAERFAEIIERATTTPPNRNTMFRVYRQCTRLDGRSSGAALMFGAAVGAGPVSAASTPKPTVVLVHGVFTDALGLVRV